MKVALYTRVSTEDQAREGFSLDVQKNYLLHHAETFEWTPFCSITGKDVYVDDGYTGYNMDRPAFQRLLSDARNKKFDMVVVYKQDRLSRNLKELLFFLDELDDLGIGFKSATEPFDTTTSAGKLAIQMLGSYAEFERNRLIERVFPGMIEGVKKGHWQGARYTPFGYIHNKETKKLEVNETEAKIVKKIFRMYLNGKSTTQIAAHYYNLGITSRSGTKFYTKFVSGILKNKVYLGTLVWNKKRYEKKVKTKDGYGKGYKTVKNDPSKIIEVPNTHEAIIKQKDFDAIQKLLTRNRKNRVVRFKDNIYHFSGVLRCNECKRTYRGKMITVNRKKKYKRAWYYCSSDSHSYMKCSNKAVTADAISKQIWDIIDVIGKNLHVIEELGDMIKMSSNESEECYTEQLQKKEQLISKNLEKQNGLYEIFSEDKINIGIYKEKAELLRNEEKRLKGEIKSVQLKILDKRNSIDVMKETQDFLIGLKRTSNKEQSDYMIKTFMRIVFKNIYIQNQEIVKVEINQPWKLCYEEGLQWIKKMERHPASTEKGKRSYVSFCVPTAAK